MSMSAATSGDSTAVDGAGEFMLFGVRVVVSDTMRKCVSLNNLAEYQHPHEMANNGGVGGGKGVGLIRGDGDGNKEEMDGGGYASADEAVHRAGGGNGGRERKRGVPWTEDEHKLFLVGLQRVGKGDWRGISRNYVKTRTPTQVASHAQKYFLRRSNLNRRRRRSSLFDITTDTVAATTMEKEQPSDPENQTQLLSAPQQSQTNETCNASEFHKTPALQLSVAPLTLPAPSLYPDVHNLIPVQCNGADSPTAHPAMHVVPVSYAAAVPNYQQANTKSLAMDTPSLSLNLFTGPDKTVSATRLSAFQVLSSISNGDNLLSVA